MTELKQRFIYESKRILKRGNGRGRQVLGDRSSRVGKRIRERKQNRKRGREREEWVPGRVEETERDSKQWGERLRSWRGPSDFISVIVALLSINDIIHH